MRGLLVLLLIVVAAGFAIAFLVRAAAGLVVGADGAAVGALVALLGAGGVAGLGRAAR